MKYIYRDEWDLIFSDEGHQLGMEDFYLNNIEILFISYRKDLSVAFVWLSGVGKKSV